MLVEALFYVIRSIVTWIAGLLPDSAFTGAGGLPSSISNMATTLGDYLGPVDNFAPMHELFTALYVFLFLWLPAAVTWNVVLWVYRHLPFIGKG